MSAFPTPLPFTAGVARVWNPSRATSAPSWVHIAIIVILFALPPATYWSTTFHDFGFRDDYSNLREAHEEPGKIIRFTASHARPLYGVLLQHSFAQADSIAELAWLRFAGAIGLSTIAIILFGLLLRLQWSLASAAFVAAMVALTPSAQIIAGWATAWPYTVAAILSIGAFASADFSGARWRTLGRASAALLVAIGALTYQPSSLFYLVGVAAALPHRRGRTLEQNLYWAGAHLAVVFTGLAMAFLTVKALYWTGVFEASARIVFERDPLGKLGWFLREPILNALNFFVLNDDRAITWHAYSLGAGIAISLLIVGAGVEWLRCGWRSGAFWLILLATLPLAAFSVNLAAAERWATYRTIFALTSILLVFMTLSWKNLCALKRDKGRWIEWSGYATALIIAVHLAQTHTYDLIASLQSHELKILYNATDHIRPNQTTDIYFVQPDPGDTPARIAYHDEFGSLSTRSDWTPKEMFKHLVRERFPNTADYERYYELQTGFRPLPKDGAFDLVIDMRAELRRFGSTQAEFGKEPDLFYLYRLIDHQQSAWASVASHNVRPGPIPNRVSCAYPTIEIWRCPTILPP